MHKTQPNFLLASGFYSLERAQKWIDAFNPKMWDDKTMKREDLIILSDEDANPMPFGHEKCPRCGNSIDPDTCWCGDARKMHASDHGFIPMGCDCGRAKLATEIPADNTKNS